MFGYVVANINDLSKEEKDRYRQFYCGLCRELGKRHGQLARLTLNYDMTFLAMLLSSLYEPGEETGEMACVMHPVKKHPFVRNQYTAYAADMTIALTYYKCVDDWKDDRKPLGKLGAKVLRKSYGQVQKRWPRQCEVIESCMQRLTDIENGSGAPDDAVNCFGLLMSELFVYEQDIWSASLRRFGNCLGRFIYLMDAAIDYEDDQKSGNYNPIITAQKTPEEIREVLTIQIGMAAEIFEKLPLVTDEHLLGSVIYAGVWQQYRAKAAKADKEA